MNRLVAFFSICLLLAPSAPVLAQPKSAPPRATLQFQGPLRDALRQLAAKGNLNLILPPGLDAPVDVHFRDVPVEEALAALARTNGLTVEKEGAVWTLQPQVPAAGTPTQAVAPAAPHELAPLPPEPPDTEGWDADDHPGGRVGTGPTHIARGEVVPEAVVYGGSLVIEGRVKEAAVAFGGELDLRPGAVIGGDAVVFGGKASLRDGSRVAGNLVVLGGEVDRAPNARVDGEVVNFGGKGLGSFVADQLGRRAAWRERHLEDDEPEGAAATLAGRAARFLLQFALFFGLGFVFLMLAPTRFKQVAEAIRQDPVRCGLFGLLGAALLLPISLFLAVTVIGIPVMLALWLAVGLGVPMGMAALASDLGARLPLSAAKKGEAAVLALGTAVLLLVGLIPVLGPLVLVLAGLLGLGAIVKTRFGEPPKVTAQPTSA